MKSIREIYKIGKGPSSSHTMGPQKAALLFRERYPDAQRYQVTLYGSLCKTGVGHGTDRVLRETLAPLPAEIVFSEEQLPNAHPNTLDFIALKDGCELAQLRVESIGGGDIRDIVCGGTNVRPGMKVAVAAPGAMCRWHGEGEPVEIKEAKLRGVKS